MHAGIKSLLTGLLFIALVHAATANDRQDIALALAVDVSISVSEHEKDLQRRGYIEAFRSTEVIEAILTGPHGSIAVTYFEWSGSIEPTIIVPWFVIDSKQSALAFAELLTRNTVRRLDTTSISGAMLFAQQLLDVQRGRVGKLIVDISGDGPNNHGMPVKDARDQLVSNGIAINGLPIMVNTKDRIFGFDLNNLDQYYRDCVIGGYGAFLVTALSWQEFPDSIRRKLVLEISGGSENPKETSPQNVRYQNADVKPVGYENCTTPGR
ncbi:MAG: DUF1194 domain-containing protein [Hyphomicrobiales bacterium]|nr:DUF1194 domain-containing protein [Hyphomicrobiales bacterium]MCP4997851.1 DUF1194 domain-containing protein [Hyphomicrobiales bacterium]